MADLSPPFPPGQPIIARPASPPAGYLPVPSDAAAAVITGSAGVGQVLTVSVASTLGGTKSYQWLRDGVAISGATATTYTQVTADTGCSISCRVSGLTYMASVRSS